MSLAMFDDAERAGENSRPSATSGRTTRADVFKSCQAGAHGSFEGDLDRLVSRTGTLTGNVRKLK